MSYLLGIFFKSLMVKPGPRSFAGTIGNQIQQCENMPVVNYIIIDCDLPDEDSLE